MKILGLSVTLAGALSAPVMACDCCSVYSAAQASGEIGRGFYGGVAQQFTRSATLQTDGQKVADEGSYINSSTSQVFAGYNFENHLSLQLNAPLISRSFGSATDHGSTAGVGDVSLLANYLVLNKHKMDFTLVGALQGGVKLPTGDSNRLGDPDFANGIGGHDLALGSGSYDGIVGGSVYSRWKRGFLAANLQYAIRSEGAFEHQYANDITWAGGPGFYAALADNYTLAFQAVVSGESKGHDTFAGVADGDSAETIVYLGPQINFTWSGKLSMQVGVDLPVSIANSGTQVVPDYRLRGAVTWRF